MKKFIVSFVFLLVSLVGCMDRDVPLPVDSAEDGLDIMISDDFARVPFDSIVVGDSALPLGTDGGGKGIFRLKKVELNRLPNETLPVPVMADDPSLPLETHDGGKSKGILRLKHLLRERLPGYVVPGQVFWDGNDLEEMD